ncbi:MAG: hypothetical protein JST79_18140 [Acidobacteria bacterium]|nr:hypothetical protein [Acidobacteriota bacterium]
MSVAVRTHRVREMQAFYKRWSPDVLTFCRLFLGNEPTAELLTSEAFAKFYRTSSVFPTTGEMPPELIGAAFHAVQPCSPERRRQPQQSVLENRIVALDCAEKAAFIMRNVLGMTWAGVANAMKVSLQEAKEFWLRGMFTVRDLLPREFFDR